jgi:hypothetical protein
MVLTLTPTKEGGYVVTSPLDLELITQTGTILEAFEMKGDTVRSLRVARAKLRQTIQSLEAECASSPSSITAR